MSILPIRRESAHTSGVCDRLHQNVRPSYLTKYIEAENGTVALAEMGRVAALLQINGHIVGVSQLSELRGLDKDSQSEGLAVDRGSFIDTFT